MGFAWTPHGQDPQPAGISGEIHYADRPPMIPLRSAYEALLLCLLAGHLVLPCRAQSLPQELPSIIDQHCVACHDGETNESNLDLLSLTEQPITSESLEIWIKVHDRVHTGEMPPAGEPRLDESSLKRFLPTTAEPIIETEQRMLAETGRSIKRRLNRYEYENSVRDLLSLPYLKIKDSLPEDRVAHGYNKSGGVGPSSNLVVLCKLTTYHAQKHKRAGRRHVAHT